jgi:hypothetical protein
MVVSSVTYSAQTPVDEMTKKYDSYMKQLEDWIIVMGSANQKEAYSVNADSLEDALSRLVNEIIEVKFDAEHLLPLLIKARDAAKVTPHGYQDRYTGMTMAKIAREMAKAGFFLEAIKTAKVRFRGNSRYDIFSVACTSLEKSTIDKADKYEVYKALVRYANTLPEVFGDIHIICRQEVLETIRDSMDNAGFTRNEVKKLFIDLAWENISKRYK